MNKDAAQGQLQQVKGSVKEALGKVTGNKRLEVEGAAEKAAGKVREQAGHAREAAEDAARDVADRLRRQGR